MTANFSGSASQRPRARAGRARDSRVPTRASRPRGARRRRGWDGLAVSLSSFLYYWPVATRQPYLGPPSPGPSLGSAVAVWLLATEQKPLDGEREEQQGGESEGEGEARHKGRRHPYPSTLSRLIFNEHFPHPTAAAALDSLSKVESVSDINIKYCVEVQFRFSQFI